MRPQLRTIEGGRRVRTIDWTRRPNTYTHQEQVIETLSQMIQTSGKTYTAIATACELSIGTVQRLAQRETLWPRPKTLFGILGYFGAELEIKVPSNRAARA